MEGATEDEVFEISANIDDMTGEDLGAAMEILFEAGALDVWFENIQMKKNRPAVKLALLARDGDEERLARDVLLHTSTLGVRMKKTRRVTLERQFKTVETEFGEVRVKEALLDGRVIKSAPEYEDVRQAARERGVTLKSVRDAALAREDARRFRHYKGGEYEYITTARHSETEEPLVVYRQLYGDGGVWARPEKMFFEDVEAGGEKIPRFREIKD